MANLTLVFTRPGLLSFLLSIFQESYFPDIDPSKNLLIILFPLSGIAVLVSAFGPNTLITDGSYGIGLAIHIGSSILAYSILTIAAAQAAVLAVQDHHLKIKSVAD